MTSADERLHAAAAAGDAEALRAAFAEGAGVNARAEFGDTALNIAAERGHGDIVDLLIAAGADIENKGGADKTPLMNAAFAGNLAVVRRLLDAGARISDDLLRSLSLKVSILEENAEAGMVRPDAAAAWRDFLEGLVAERRKQDEQARN
ncbi:MAG: ankyrin repeat domain-containing protein [Hyphomonadaceae bacterium]